MTNPREPYKAQCAKPAGPRDARPTALQVVKDNDRLDTLTNHTMLITGCSSGIGVETARALHATGADIYVTARDVPRTEKVLSDLVEKGRFKVIHMDLTSLASVRSGTAEFLKASGGKLNVLVNNAGIMAVPTLEKSLDGFEMQFAVNHLSHFLLFNLVKDALRESSSPAFQSRVVCVSSSGHRNSGWTARNYNFDPAKGHAYSAWGAYGQSKMANVWMANYIERHFGPEGIHALSLHPGGIATPLQKYQPGLIDMENETVRNVLASEEQGAATTVWAAVGKTWEGEGGRFLEEVKEAGEYPDQSMGCGPGGYAKECLNVEAQEMLWKDSLEMVGLS